MSLGFGLPNFPVSQIVLGHLGWDLLGNWEFGKYVPVIISQFPNFPNGAGPSGLRSFGKLGNWEVCTCNHFPISQIVLLGNWEIEYQMGWDLLRNREIGKYVPQAISQFPKSAKPNGLGSFGKLGI